MFELCYNPTYTTDSVTEFDQINNQITICNAPKYKSLEVISLSIYRMTKRQNTEYNIKEVLTKTEGNLENMKNEYYTSYKSIIIDGKPVFLLKDTIFLVEQTNDGYYFTNKDLNIISSGKKFEDAEQNMYEEFLIQWELYAVEKDENLTKRAQIIKKHLLESVKL
ncbi:MAG: hypothetical protein PHX04_00580 [Bacilli bacterium]|nr:hypothetical protein [Bacilli bacterium]